MMASASIWNTGVKSIVQFRNLTALCILLLATLAGSVQARDISMLTASTIANLVTLLAPVTVMAIVMTIVMNYIIIGPITRLAKPAEDTSHGNLKQKIRPESHDEIGQLAEAFYLMQTSLRVAFKRIYTRPKST